jgi:hypothetical protein
MQKNNRKCYQISQMAKQRQAARRLRELEDHHRENGRRSTFNDETSHYSKEEDNSSFFPNIATNRKKYASSLAGLATVSIRAYPICTATCEQLPVETNSSQCQEQLVLPLWQGSCKIIGSAPN